MTIVYPMWEDAGRAVPRKRMSLGWAHGLLSLQARGHALCLRTGQSCRGVRGGQSGLRRYSHRRLPPPGRRYRQGTSKED